jgi:hypothetical protein
VSTAQNISGTSLLECSSGWSSHVPECWPFKAVFSFGNSQKSHWAKSGEYGGWMDGFQYRFFWPKTPRQQACYEQGHCYDARSKHQAKVQVFSDKQPHATLPIFPNNAGSLFDLSLIFLPEQKRMLV